MQFQNRQTKFVWSFNSFLEAYLYHTTSITQLRSTNKNKWKNFGFKVSILFLPAFTRLLPISRSRSTVLFLQFNRIKGQWCLQSEVFSSNDALPVVTVKKSLQGHWINWINTLKFSDNKTRWVPCLAYWQLLILCEEKTRFLILYLYEGLWRLGFCHI